MAQGVAHTHAAKSEMALGKLAEWMRELADDDRLSEVVLSANTARHAFDLIHDQCPQAIFHVGRQIVKAAEVFAGPGLKIRSVIFDYNGNIFFDSELD